MSAGAWAQPGERVLAIVPGFASDLEDAAIPSLRALLLDLVAAGVDVRVLALRHPPGRRDYGVGPLQVRTLGGGDARGAHRLLLLERARRTAMAMAGDVDRVIGFWADEPGWIAVQVARARGLPAHVALMGGELAALRGLGYGVGLQRLGRRLVEHALLYADRVSVGSAWLGARAEAHPAVQRRRVAGTAPPIAVLPLPLEERYRGDAVARRPLPAADAPLVVGCAASLVPVKRHAALLRALARDRRGGREVRLRLAGDGPELRPLAALAAALGVTEAVEFLGALAPREMPAFYRSVDLHLLASAWEAQGMATLEAWACGAAVGGTRVGAIADYLQTVPPEAAPLALQFEVVPPESRRST